MDEHELRVKWDALFRRHHLTLKMWVIGRGIRPSRAEEICQEVWTILPQRDREGKLPYIEMPGLAIHQARWLIHDEYRRRRRDDHEMPVHLVDPSTRPDRRAEDREELAIVLALIDALPPRQREIFIACRRAESYEAAREILGGGSIQHLKQTVCRVVAHLRTELARRRREIRSSSGDEDTIPSMPSIPSRPLFLE
jgi:RNA polymerase sigma factor (sigma-70 family)